MAISVFTENGWNTQMSVAERFKGANVVDAGRFSPYWGEHAARYVHALRSIDGGKVLDIACGTGYGLGLLRKRAAFVVGVDIDHEAATDAKSERGTNAAVLLGDGTRLPFAAESFDVVTSFETLEHLHKRAEFLAELNRVLRMGGRLFLSTPNAAYTMPVNGKPTNQFHVHEYTADELRRELEKHFVIVDFLGQSLSPPFSIPPFFDAQRRLPRDPITQAKLFWWKAFNKLPFKLREGLSEAIWRRPFYPTESDYIFSIDRSGTAPVLYVTCQKTDGPQSASEANVPANGRGPN
jgi:2-polyprenyl-3-methyl-5-hydroxy-6-metoxy-1,4-benzoquinol methylase